MVLCSGFVSSVTTEYKQFLRRDGTILVELQKALYDIVEAPRLWHDTSSAYLFSRGFKRSELDDCYFVKQLENGGMMDITIHVDDGKVTSDSVQEIDELILAFKSRQHF